MISRYSVNLARAQLILKSSCTDNLHLSGLSVVTAAVATLHLLLATSPIMPGYVCEPLVSFN